MFKTLYCSDSLCDVDILRRSTLSYNMSAFSFDYHGVTHSRDQIMNAPG
jgi:hypothetical protein